MGDAHLLDGIAGKLLDMEPVYDPLGIREPHQADVPHGRRQVQRYLGD